MRTQRIDFIDLAKGICIILVMMGHCGTSFYIKGLEYVRLPLYFILSGLFFKDYGSYLNILIKKTNRILIPFLFFYLVSYAIFYVFEFFELYRLTTWSHGLSDIFYQRHLFNNAIWFLLTLYWCNLIFAGIHSILTKQWLRILAVLLLGGLGLYLGYQQTALPLYLDIACTAMPFYAFGYYLKKTPLLYKHRWDRYNLPLAALLYGLCYSLSCLTPYNIDFYCNTISNPLLGYCIATLGVLFILLCCKCIKKIAPISYLGHYSLIALCTHQLINNFLRLWGQEPPYEILQNPYLRLTACLISSYALIPLCLRYIPYFVAQKELIPHKDNKAK